jgi:hypothetical protein
MAALHDDFQRRHCQPFRKSVARSPGEYLKVVASVMPKCELKVTTESELTDDQLDQRIRQLASINQP